MGWAEPRGDVLGYEEGVMLSGIMRGVVVFSNTNFMSKGMIE